MTDVVLDASAVLAFLQGETGGDEAYAAFAQGLISGVNYAEVITKLINNGSSADDAEHRAARLGLELAPVTEPRAIAAGRLHARTLGRGISLGDRFCLALAEELGLPVLTSDRRWVDLGLGVEITLIR